MAGEQPSPHIQRRFHLLVRAIRFDNAADRSNKLDNLAPIGSLFEKFVEKCYSSYTPYQYVTIDEMLDSFRGNVVSGSILPINLLNTS